MAAVLATENTCMPPNLLSKSFSSGSPGVSDHPPHRPSRVLWRGARDGEPIGRAWRQGWAGCQSIAQRSTVHRSDQPSGWWSLEGRLGRWTARAWTLASQPRNLFILGGSIAKTEAAASGGRGAAVAADPHQRVALGRRHAVAGAAAADPVVRRG